MRTTLRLDDDVVALIEKARKANGASLTEVVNAALRDGLVRMEALAPRRKLRASVHSCGQCYLPNLDNTAEVLAVAEGEQFR